jgi:hypothetical protein
MTRTTKGRWEARNIRLNELLMSAFRVNQSQIVVVIGKAEKSSEN